MRIEPGSPTTPVRSPDSTRSSTIFIWSTPPTSSGHRPARKRPRVEVDTWAFNDRAQAFFGSLRFRAKTRRSWITLRREEG
jgi:hypothetical protein